MPNPSVCGSWCSPIIQESDTVAIEDDRQVGPKWANTGSLFDIYYYIVAEIRGVALIASDTSSIYV